MVMIKKALFDRLPQMMSDERWQHTKRVCEHALRLAKLHSIDEDRVIAAALLHDACKEWSYDKLFIYLEKFLPNWLIYPVDIWHGPVAALWAKHDLKIDDQGILDAIYYHTVGRPRMGLLEKVIYLADLTESARSYEGVDDIRAYLPDNMTQALGEALRQSIIYLANKKKMIHPLTILAYNEYFVHIYDRSY